MKRKVLSLILAICLTIPCAIAFTACANNDSKTAKYTVTELEWKTNLNLTKETPQAQTLSSELSRPSQVKSFASSVEPLSKITSYTVHAEGVNTGTPGSAVLKMALNGMSTEFYVNGVLKESETGTFDNSHVLYQSVKTNMMLFIPFAENYDDFIYDETKKAYVAQNLTATVVDDYDTSKTNQIYHKKAEVYFVNGYLSKVYFEMSNEKSVELSNNFDDVIAIFTFTFSKINSTVVNI